MMEMAGSRMTAFCQSNRAAMLRGDVGARRRIAVELGG